MVLKSYAFFILVSHKIIVYKKCNTS